MSEDMKKEKGINIIVEGIDVLEESIRKLDPELLNILLFDRTTHKNILWATNDYKLLGAGFEEFSEILPSQVTGQYASLIQPRITKTQNAQNARTRNKAEVFTPSWICNKQNNLIDAQWFGRDFVFNIEDGMTWSLIEGSVSFAGAKDTWRKYVDAQRLEISCGEAPYLVSRYDTVTGKRIPLNARIGLLDRKMRIVKENTKTAEDWLKWSQRAFESIYGYEYQGDNVLLARENLLYSYIEYYTDRFEQAPDITLLRNIARIISWNIWQMDGTKYVVPGSCEKSDSNRQLTIFDYLNMDSTLADEQCRCPGCKTGNIYNHIGTYCKIMDWRSKCSRTFISFMGKGV